MDESPPPKLLVRLALGLCIGCLGMLLAGGAWLVWTDFGGRPGRTSLTLLEWTGVGGIIGFCTGAIFPRPLDATRDLIYGVFGGVVIAFVWACFEHAIANNRLRQAGVSESWFIPKIHLLELDDYLRIAMFGGIGIGILAGFTLAWFDQVSKRRGTLVKSVLIAVGSIAVVAMGVTELRFRAFADEDCRRALRRVEDWERQEAARRELKSPANDNGVQKVGDEPRAQQ